MTVISENGNPPIFGDDEWPADAPAAVPGAIAVGDSVFLRILNIGWGVQRVTAVDEEYVTISWRGDEAWQKTPLAMCRLFRRGRREYGAMRTRFPDLVDAKPEATNESIAALFEPLKVVVDDAHPNDFDHQMMVLSTSYENAAAELRRVFAESPAPADEAYHLVFGRVTRPDYTYVINAVWKAAKS